MFHHIDRTESKYIEQPAQIFDSFSDLFKENAGAMDHAQSSLNSTTSLDRARNRRSLAASRVREFHGPPGIALEICVACATFKVYTDCWEEYKDVMNEDAVFECFIGDDL